MFPYFLITIGVICLSFLSQLVDNHFSTVYGVRGTSRKPSSRINIFDIMAMFLLVAFSALRVGVGTDYYMYVRIFDDLESQSWESSISNSTQEIGYTFLSLVVQKFSNSITPLLWIMSALTVVPIYLSLKRLSLNLTLAVAMYMLLTYYFTPFNIMRQGVAIAINFYSLRFVVNHPRRFIFLNLIASSFHISAALAALVQMISRKWVPSVRIVWLTIAVSGLAVGLLASSTAVRGFVGLLNPRYESYLSGGDLVVAGYGSFLLVLTRILLIAVSLMLVSNSDLSIYRVYLILALPFVIGGIASPAFGRIDLFFSISCLVAIPNQLSLTMKSEVYRWAVVLGGLVYFAFSITHYNGLLPYRMDL